MKIAAARAEARARWGAAAGYAHRSDTPDIRGRCQVGIEVADKRFPLGAGKTFEAAFAQAEKLGQTPERVHKVVDDVLAAFNRRKQRIP